MKNGTERGFYATVSALRYPLLNYRGEVPLESTFAGIRMLNLKALPDEKKDELRAWRKTLLGSVAMMAARTKRRTDANVMKMESDGGDNSKAKG